MAGPKQRAASCAALPTASPLQERGRERPHPPLAIAAPRPPKGSLTPSVSTSMMRWLLACWLASCRFNSCRRRTGPNRPAKGEPSCARIMRNIARPLVPLRRQLACGGCVRSFGRPPRLSILERHARASSLGAPRRPVRAAGLTRARLARLGSYVMASRCAAWGFPNDKDAYERATRPLSQINEVSDPPEMRSHLFYGDDDACGRCGKPLLCGGFPSLLWARLRVHRDGSAHALCILRSGAVKGPWCRPVGRAA